MIHVTSDLHFGHAKVIEYCNRPFKNVDEMNIALIKNWNQKVQDGDQVIVGGDFALSKPDYAISILKQLRGTICLVEGNHDKGCLKSKEFRDRFEWIRPLTEIKVPDPDAYRGEQRIVLCHFAMRVWNKSHHGSIHLHGHSHGSLKPHGKSVDVGVDSPFVTGKREYRPFSYQEIKHFMKRQEIAEIDHHTGDRDG